MSDNLDYLDYTSSEYLDSMYETYKSNPEEVEPQWRKFFEGMDFAMAKNPVLPNDESTQVENSTHSLPEIAIQKQIGIMKLINAYRSRGHLVAENNPIRPRSDHKPRLSLEYFNLSEADMNTKFAAGRELGLGLDATLSDILGFLKETYCRTIGVEFMHLRKTEVMLWLRGKMESCKNYPNFDLEKKKKILHKLNEAEVFETFIHTKYLGQKRFSLEGGEVLIPALDAIIEKGAELNCKHFIIGMAHRGRLNVLANILGKTYEDVFSEFEDFADLQVQGSGDVKYHKGYSTIRNVGGEDVKLTLAFNPSHLEAVNPVVQGMARAKAEQWFDNDYTNICPIIIHGDAAISGQGVVYEQLQMSHLPGYEVGGSIHIVVNNQVGFTTHFKDGRSTIYCTDVAKSTFCPVIHVNGNDPEAVVYAVELAIEFRQKYQRDVFIELVVYRKHGHNETDEPRFTQPLMYKMLDKIKSPREQYSEHLHNSGLLDSKLAAEMQKEFKTMLQERLERAKESQKASAVSSLQSKWGGFRFSNNRDFAESPETGVDLMRLKQVGGALHSIPEGFKPIKNILRQMKARQKMVESGQLDWAMGELYAYGSLLLENHPVRVSGQDVQRGTFSHRHALVKDENTEEHFINLNNISDNQSKLYIYNSLLSEYAVLGFEYGYSLATPRRLTIWEAQFGDFSNGAQIIIDQFLSSAESKWQLSSGLVMLLPHGYEGQGPEHSSGRMERFLQLCAEDNIIVANCTTPANFFHIMRRQLKWEFRKPLIVFTPKSLLRHPECVSRVEDMGPGTTFLEVIDDPTVTNDASIKKVILCTGKLYYELKKERDERKEKDVAIVRLEQLHPLPNKQIKELAEKYSECKTWIWAQEEPQNMGAWDFLSRNFKGPRLKCVSRKASASPAEGSAKGHRTYQRELIEKCFN